jgi:hypothetical protein
MPSRWRRQRTKGTSSCSSKRRERTNSTLNSRGLYHLIGWWHFECRHQPDHKRLSSTVTGEDTTWPSLQLHHIPIPSSGTIGANCARTCRWTLLWVCCFKINLHACLFVFMGCVVFVAEIYLQRDNKPVCLIILAEGFLRVSGLLDRRRFGAKVWRRRPHSAKRRLGSKAVWFDATWTCWRQAKNKDRGQSRVAK